MTDSGRNQAAGAWIDGAGRLLAAHGCSGTLGERSHASNAKGKKILGSPVEKLTMFLKDSANWPMK